MSESKSQTHTMKIQHIVSALVLLGAALLASPAPGKELIRDFSGERTMKTAEFQVEAPWILDWRVTGEYADEMAVDVSLVRSDLNAHEGNVLKARGPGNGVRLFNQDGRFFFQVDSTLAGWRLRVFELTPEEAEEYTPRTQTPLDY